LSALLLFALILGVAHVLPVLSPSHLADLASSSGLAAGGAALGPVAAGVAAGIVVYCFRILAGAIAGVAQRMRGKDTPGGVLVLPLVLVGLPLLAGEAAMYFTANPGWFALPYLAGALVIVSGILLWLTDRTGLTIRRLEHLGPATALVAGLAPLVSLLPAASSLSWLLLAARLFHFERPDALRLAALGTVPTLLFHAVQHGVGDWPPAWWLAAAACAWAGSLLALTVLGAWLRRHDLAFVALLEVAIGILLLFA
jgi:undecaprenyl-diphosphatase